jgi:hypothetical protein
MPIETGVCEKCGMGVHLDEEGRTTCDGCNRSTATCTCESAQQGQGQPQA